MDKRNKKLLRNEFDNLEEKNRAISNYRKIGIDIDYPEAGELVVQILELPTEHKGICLDIRNRAREYYIYKTSVDWKNRLIEPGYDELNIPNDFLVKLLNELDNIELPIKFNKFEKHTTFGTTYVARVINSDGNFISISWCGEHPEEWKPFTNIINRFIERAKEYF